jgi:hypothetical protein
VIILLLLRACQLSGSGAQKKKPEDGLLAFLTELLTAKN